MARDRCPVPCDDQSRDRPERTPARALARPARRSRPGRVPGRSGRRSGPRDHGDHPRQPPGDPGDVLRVHPRRSHRRPRPRGRGGGPGCGRAARRTTAAARRRPGRGAQRAGRARARRRHAVRTSVGRDAGARRHRHQRQDDHHLPARADRDACRRSRRRGRHRGRADGGGERRHLHLECAHHARGERAAGPARADARRGDDDGRDGGVVTRAAPAQSRRRAVRGGVLHQPESRAPRLPRFTRRVLRREGIAVHTRAYAGGRDQHRRRARGRARAARGP